VRGEGRGALQKWVLHAIRRSRRREFFRSFYYMIFDVSDAEAKRVAAGHHRQDDGLRNAVSGP